MKFKGPAETEAWAREFARTLVRPTVVLLSGGLGAGKTQLTTWILDELGVADVSSPTFAIHHRYGTIDHVDLYRLESDADLDSVGFWDLFANDDGLVFVEWADRLPRDAWPTAWTRIFVDVRVTGSERANATENPPGAREITLLYARPGSTLA